MMSVTLLFSAMKVYSAKKTNNVVFDYSHSNTLQFR